MNRLLLCAALCTAVGALAGPPSDPGGAPGRVTMLTAPADPGDVRAAVLAGLKAKSWNVAEEHPGRVTAWLSHRRNELQIQVSWDGASFVVQDLRSNTDARRTDSYLAGLEAAIQKQLRRAARAPPQREAPAEEAPVLAGEAGDLPPPVMAVFSREQPFEAVRGVLARALAARGWTAEADEPNGLLASHPLRGGYVRVRITSTTQQSTISFVEAKNLRAHGDYLKLANALGDAITASSR